MKGNKVFHCLVALAFTHVNNYWIKEIPNQMDQIIANDVFFTF